MLRRLGIILLVVTALCIVTSRPVRDAVGSASQARAAQPTYPDALAELPPRFSELEPPAEKTTLNLESVPTPVTSWRPMTSRGEPLPFDVPPPSFDSAVVSDSQSHSAQPLFDERVKFDPTEGTSYVVSIHGNSNEPHREVIQQRQHGGKLAEIKDFVQNAGVSDIRLYVENFEVVGTDDKLEFQCDGKVVLVAQQSALTGEGLKYADEEFRIGDAEIVTPDAVIQAGSCTYQFEIGSFSVAKLPPAEQKQEHDPEASAAPRFKVE